MSWRDYKDAMVTIKQLDAENARLHAELWHMKGLNERLCERLTDRPIVAPKTTYDQDRFPANPKNGDTFRWFSNDGWYKRICENGLWERHEAPKTKIQPSFVQGEITPKFEEYRTHFYWLGSAAEVMNREPKLPRGVRTYFSYPTEAGKIAKYMNLGKYTYWYE